MAMQIDRISAVLSAYADLTGFSQFENRLFQSANVIENQARRINAALASMGNQGNLGAAISQANQLTAVLDRLSQRQSILSGSRGNYAFVDDLSRQLNSLTVAYQTLELVSQRTMQRVGSQRVQQYQYGITGFAQQGAPAQIQGAAPTRAAMEADLRRQLGTVLVPALSSAMDTIRRESLRATALRALPPAPFGPPSYRDWRRQEGFGIDEAWLRLQELRGRQVSGSFGPQGQRVYATELQSSTIPKDLAGFVRMLAEERANWNYALGQVRAYRPEAKALQVRELETRASNMPDSYARDFLNDVANRLQIAFAHGVTPLLSQTGQLTRNDIIRMDRMGAGTSGGVQEILGAVFGTGYMEQGRPYWLSEGRWQGLPSIVTPLQELLDKKLVSELPPGTNLNRLNNRPEIWRNVGYELYGDKLSPEAYGPFGLLGPNYKRKAITGPGERPGMELALRDFFAGGSTIWDQIPRVVPRAAPVSPQAVSAAQQIKEIMDLLGEAPTRTPVQTRSQLAALRAQYPPYLYHGTNVEDLRSILPAGMQGTGGNRAWFTRDPMEAWQYAQQRTRERGVGRPTVYVVPSASMAPGVANATAPDRAWNYFTRGETPVVGVLRNLVQVIDENEARNRRFFENQLGTPLPSYSAGLTPIALGGRTLPGGWGSLIPPGIAPYRVVPEQVPGQVPPRPIAATQYPSWMPSIGGPPPAGLASVFGGGDLVRQSGRGQARYWQKFWEEQQRLVSLGAPRATFGPTPSPSPRPSSWTGGFGIPRTSVGADDPLSRARMLLTAGNTPEAVAAFTQVSLEQVQQLQRLIAAEAQATAATQAQAATANAAAAANVRHAMGSSLTPGARGPLAIGAAPYAPPPPGTPLAGGGTVVVPPPPGARAGGGGFYGAPPPPPPGGGSYSGGGFGGWFSARKDEFMTGFRGRGELPYTQQFGQAAKFSLMYGVAYNALFQIGQIFQQSVQQAIEFDNALVNLNLVTNRATEANMELANNLGDIAAASGFSPAEGVTAGARAIGIFGLTEAGQAEQERAAIANTRVVSQTAYASGRQFADIQKDMGAIVQAFSLGPEMQTAVQDYDAKLTKTFGLLTGSTLETVAQIGTLGAEAGFSMEEVFAMAAKVQSRTGQTPAATAGMLSQIYGRAGDAGVREAFAKVGVDTSKSFRDQIAQMSEIFPTLSAQQQAQIFDVFGKGRGKGAATIVVQDWEAITAAAKEAQGAIGEGQKQWEMRMGTVGGQLAELAGSLQNLAKNIGESGLLDAFALLLKGVNAVVDGLNTVVELFNLIPRPIRDLAIGLALLTAAVKFATSSTMTKAVTDKAGNVLQPAMMKPRFAPGTFSGGQVIDPNGNIIPGAGGARIYTPANFPGTVVQGQPGYRGALLRDMWLSRPQVPWLQPGYRIPMPQFPDSPADLRRIWAGEGGTGGIKGGTKSFFRGAGAALGSELGVIGTAIIGAQLVSQAYSQTQANLAAMEAFKLAATTDFGSSATELENAARTLHEAGQALGDQDSGVFAWIFNKIGEVFGGPNLGEEKVRADQLAKVYEDAAKRKREGQEEFARATEPEGVAASIDLTSADSLSQSMKLLDDSGRSATTQFWALAGALDAIRVGTEVAATVLKDKAPDIASAAQAQFGQNFTGLTDMFDNAQGTWVDESLRRFGMRWLSTAPDTLTVTASGGRSVTLGPEQTQFIADQMRATDIPALSEGVGSATQAFLEGGGNPLTPEGRQLLTEAIAKQYETYFTNWTQIDPVVQASMIEEAVGMVVAAANNQNVLEDPNASLDAILKYGQQAAQGMAKEAGLTGSGPRALTEAQSYLSGLQLMRSGAAAKGALPSQLEAIDIAILEAEEAVAQAQIAHIKALLDYQTSKMATTDTEGQLKAQLDALMQQIELTQDPDAQSALWAQYYRAQDQLAVARRERRAARRTARLNPYDTVGAAQAELDNAEAQFNQIDRMEKDAEKHSAAYWQAYQRVQQAKASLAQAEIENAYAVDVAGIDPRNTLALTEARIKSLRDRLAIPEGEDGYLPEGSTERANVETELAQAEDERRRQASAQAAAARRAAINPRDTTALALDSIRAARDALRLELPGTEAWYRAKAELDQARASYQDLLRQVASARANARAIQRGGDVAAAKASLRAARANLEAQIPGTVEFYQALAGVYEAQDALANAHQAARKVRDLLGVDITDPVAEAQVEVDAARRKLERDRRKNKSPEVIRADELDVRRAEMAAENARFQQWFSDLQTNEQLKRITHGQYLRTLEAERDRLLAVGNRTRQQQDQLNQIEQAIQSAKTEMDAQWNIGDIRIPTPYQMRAWLARQAGGYYADPTGSGSPISLPPPAISAAQPASTTTIYINGADVGMVQRELSRALGQGNTTRMGTRPRK